MTEKYCSGLDSDLPDILESDLEGRADTNCYLEESWNSQGTMSLIQFAFTVHEIDRVLVSYSVYVCFIILLSWFHSVQSAL